MAGTESETLSVQQIPNHTHPFTASTALGTQANPEGAVMAQTPASIRVLIEDVPAANMNAGAITAAGGSQPHENCQPFLCVNFIISLFGVFPSPT